MIIIATLALALGQAAAPAPKKEKKICRKIEVIGSNLPRQECHTAAEWKAHDAANALNESDQAQLQRSINQGQRNSPH